MKRIVSKVRKISRKCCNDAKQIASKAFANIKEKSLSIFFYSSGCGIGAIVTSILQNMFDCWWKFLIYFIVCFGIGAFISTLALAIGGISTSKKKR